MPNKAGPSRGIEEATLGGGHRELELYHTIALSRFRAPSVCYPPLLGPGLAGVQRGRRPAPRAPRPRLKPAPRAPRPVRPLVTATQLLSPGPARPGTRISWENNRGVTRVTYRVT